MLWLVKFRLGQVRLGLVKCLSTYGPSEKTFWR